MSKKFQDYHQVRVTSQGYEELVNELSALKDEKRPAAVARVQRAREFGDLSENAEYHASREDLNFIDGRIEELSDILSRAKVMKASRSKKTVNLGCKVTVLASAGGGSAFGGNGRTRVFTVVGEWEANPAEEKISHDSPLGKALLGRKVGEKIEIEAPAGVVTYTVKKIH